MFARHKKEKITQTKDLLEESLIIYIFSFLIMCYATDIFKIRFNNNKELSKYFHLLVETINCILIILCIYKTGEEC